MNYGFCIRLFLIFLFRYTLAGSLTTCSSKGQSTDITETESVTDPSTHPVTFIVNNDEQSVGF